MDIWTSAKAQLRLQMTRATYETWLDQTHQVGDIEDNRLTILAAFAHPPPDRRIDLAPAKSLQTISGTIPHRL